MPQHQCVLLPYIRPSAAALSPEDASENCTLPQTRYTLSQEKRETLVAMPAEEEEYVGTLV